ncbi:hypothetical protein BRAO375_3780011 [Bradyrhizobium sp. ORS 375]|uniref:hypothetical protein n=1 Tax=Bradyrhizobium sp. (strain ORS 375) TaxID=566679 RepID=UPI0002406F40|nr:hypothetical protein [Bradyrhizobium sp. ORS 375]CCD94896.1 hypothetical protein BRAO375_3780011 [Bradyrhizobium sp. ORS 375]
MSDRVSALHGLPPIAAALSIIRHFPDLQLVDGAGQAAVTRHIREAEGFDTFVQSLSEQGPPAADAGWARLEPILLSGGAPASDPHGNAIARLRLSDATLAAMIPVLAAALRSVRQDPALQGTCWTVQEGIAPGPAVAGRAGGTWSLTNLAPRFGVAFSEVTYEADTPAFTLAMTNAVPRHLAVYATFLQAGAPVAPADWQTRLPAGAAALEGGAARFLGVLAPSVPVAAIPVAADPQAMPVALPQGADAITLSFAGLGAAAFEPEASVLGAVLTAVLDHAVPAVLIQAGGGHAHDGWFKGLLQNSKLAAEIMVCAASIAADSSIVDSPSLLDGLASRIDAMLLGPELSDLRVGLDATVHAGAVADAAPFLNWSWTTLRALLAPQALPQANSALLTSPASFGLTLSPAMVVDLEVEVSPDPEHGEWPDAAAQFEMAVRDGAGFLYTQKAQLTSDSRAATVDMTFRGLRAEGQIRVDAVVRAANGWPCAEATAILDPRAGLPNRVIKAAIAVKERRVPITAATRYRHARKLIYDTAAGRYAWTSAGAPTAVAASLDQAACAAGRRALCGLVTITLQESARTVGYCWQASGQGLPDCQARTGGVSVGYLFQNIGIIDPSVGLKTLDCVFIEQPLLAYDRGGDAGAAREGRGWNFYLEVTPNGYRLRSVAFDAQPGFALGQRLSWGGLIEPNLAKVVVQPAGYVLAVDTGSGKLEILRLSPASVEDGRAPAPTLAAGEGKDAGLLAQPVALAVMPDGVVLVLENGNARLQAFDVYGNPVPYFANASPVLSLPSDGGVTYLDVAASAAGSIYVLSCRNGGATAADYTLDIYARDGGMVTRTEGVAAGRIAVDSWGRVYALNFEEVTGMHGRSEPTISQWVPQPPDAPARRRMV